LCGEISSRGNVNTPLHDRKKPGKKKNGKRVSQRPHTREEVEKKRPPSSFMG